MRGRSPGSLHDCLQMVLSSHVFLAVTTLVNRQWSASKSTRALRACKRSSLQFLVWRPLQCPFVVLWIARIARHEVYLAGKASANGHGLLTLTNPACLLESNTFMDVLGRLTLTGASIS